MNRTLGRKLRDVTGPLFDPLYFLYLLVDEAKVLSILSALDTFI